MEALSAKSEKPRLSNLVADRITHAIVQRKMAPGSLIGLEPDLMRDFGVSRATLREAIRQVESRGVARMRRGSGGGLIAAGTPVSIAAGTLATFLEVSDITLAEQTRTRNLLECAAAGLAAVCASKAQISSLRSAVARLEGVADPVQARQLQFALREEIADVSGDAMLALATSAFYRVTVDLSALLTGSAEVVERYIAAQVEQKHALVEAIAAGDRLTAMALVRQEGKDLLSAETFLPYLDTALPDLVLKSGQPLTADRPADEKLGITTALRLRRDIAALGWPVGQNLGTEQQLRERYGVSRSLLREALMLLEINGIVHILRGRVGGIVVGRPDPQASIRTIVDHMRYLDLDDAELREIVCFIDVEAAGRAAQAIDPDHLARLFPSPTGGDGVPPDYGALAHGLHEIAANRAATLICEIVKAFSTRAAEPVTGDRGCWTHWRGLRDALSARDAALAERHMRGLWGRLQPVAVSAARSA